MYEHGRPGGRPCSYSANTFSRSCPLPRHAAAERSRVIFRRAYARKIPLTKGSVAAPALPGLRSRAARLPSALAACRRREEKGEGGTSVPPFSLHTRIHSKQDNCLVLIAPTARWILMRRTDAQSAAVPMKLSYFNAYGTKLQALKAKACSFVPAQGFWTKLSKNLAPSTGVL